MKVVTIYYKDKNFKFNIPSNPLDLTGNDWLYLYKNRLLEKNDFLVGFFRWKFSSLPLRVLKSISAEEVLEICSEFEFLYAPITPTICPFPKLSIKKYNYTTLEDPFDKLSSSQYAYIENCILDFADTKDFFYLFKLISILYDPSNIVNEDVIISRAEFFRKYMPDEQAQLIYDWFLNCHKKLEEEYAPVFKKTGKQSNVESLGFVEVIYSLAGDKLGTVEKVEKENVKSILMAAWLEMNAAARLNESLKAK